MLGVIDFGSFYDFCNYILELNSDSVHNVFLNKVFMFSVKVCSNKLDLYENMCAFKRIQCALDREDIPIVNTTSPCTEKKGGNI